MSRPLWMLLLSLSCTQGLAADSVDASVGALAGIAPVLSLTCDDVDFSVVRVPARSATAATVLDLKAQGRRPSDATNVLFAQETTDVALASGYDSPASASCNVTGSNNPGQRIAVSIAQQTDIRFGPSNHRGMAAPGQLADLRADLSLAEYTVEIDADGAGVFRVDGTLLIPAVVIPNNYGSYRSSTAADGGNDNFAIVTVIDVAQ